MQIFRTPADVRSFRAALKQPLAFVPTMGALHEGHVSLIERARAQAPAVAVSIFVNPLQFGPNEDFARYPRVFERDCDLLASLGIAFLYAPAVETMYPQGFATRVDTGAIGTLFEGAVRPGHFDGVATVMTKLLSIVTPDVFVMGQKDAQQVAMLRQLLRDLDLPYEMVVAPTVREADGLALSSRNAYLSVDDRAAAPSLSAALRTAARAIANGETGASAAIAAGRRLLDPRLREDYFAIVDPQTFHALEEVRGVWLAIGAVRAGTTRLIDNVAPGDVAA